MLLKIRRFNGPYRWKKTPCIAQFESTYAWGIRYSNFILNASPSSQLVHSTPFRAQQGPTYRATTGSSDHVHESIITVYVILRISAVRLSRWRRNSLGSEADVPCDRFLQPRPTRLRYITESFYAIPKLVPRFLPGLGRSRWETLCVFGSI